MSEMPRWNREPCDTCNGSGKSHKKRKRPCPDCNGSGTGDICADCGKFISPRPAEVADECKCQEIPPGHE